MKIINENPPNIEKIKEAFDFGKHKPVFAYGDTIYNPWGEEIPHHLVVHEEVHSKQQGEDPEGWWDTYIEDPIFRLAQEVEAHHVQYNYLKTVIKNREALNHLTIFYARAMSGPLYNHMVTYSDAIKLIKYGKL